MKLPHMPVAVVFDMDGLLFDTEALYQQAFTRAASDKGHDMPLSVFLGMVGHPWPVNRVQLLKHYGAAFPVDEFGADVRRHFGSMADADLRLKPGVTGLLDFLDELRVPRAIATSSARDAVRHHLAAHALGDRFDAVVALGDYAAGKPAPDPFLTAAERLGVAPRSCLALEDSYAGVRSASSAGMVTIMVPDLLQPTDEIRRLCTHVASDLHEVRGLLAAASSPAAT